MRDYLSIRLEVTQEAMRAALAQHLHTDHAEFRQRIDAQMAKVDLEALLEDEIGRQVRSEVESLVRRAVAERRMRLATIVDAAADARLPKEEVLVRDREQIRRELERLDHRRRELELMMEEWSHG